MKKHTIDDLAQRIHDIKDREEAELRRLSEDPSLFLFAQLFCDRMDKELLRLCNYDRVIDNLGNAHDIQDVIASVQDGVRKTFRELTGRDYTSDICRQIDYVRSDPNRREGAV